MKKQEKPKVIHVGRLTEEEIQLLMKKHNVKVCHTLIVPANDEETELGYCYIKKPDRAVLTPVLSIYDQNPVKAKELLLNSCWMEGDERIRTDDDMFFSALYQIDEIIRIRRAVIKKNSLNG